MINIILICFLLAFITSMFTLFYSITLSKKLGNKGLLHKALFYLTITSLVYGVHYISKIMIYNSTYGNVLAEITEASSTILLGVTVYYFYKITQGI